MYTAKGTKIPNERPLPKTPDEMAQAAKLWKRQCPDAVLRSSASTYNCVGMVLAFRRTSIVETDALPKYLSEDGYRRLVDPPEPPMRGDVVIYRDQGSITHVGIVLHVPPVDVSGRINPMILSKWGSAGEYIHKLMDVPKVYGAEVEYWTERVP